MTYFTGHKPDPESVRQRRAGFHLLKSKRTLGALPLPPKTNNRQFLLPSLGGPGILDQHDTSSCEGHAHASGITLRFAIARKPIALVSPVGIYDVARMISRIPNADGTLPILSDDGTEPNLVISGLGEWGCCSAASWGNYPASSVNINDEPSVQQLEATSEFELQGAYAMQSSGDQFVRDLMTAMASGFPVSSAIAASSNAFQSYSGGVLGPLDDQVDHASLWVDFENWDGSDLSKVTFVGCNSWSPAWGWSDIDGISGGLYQFNADFARKYCQDAYVLDVSPIGGGEI